MRALWLLSARDLRVRYATSALGYLWSVLDPLAMALIYWFVFTQVFQRGSVGESPYIVFLILGVLPWVWFNTSVTDFTRAFRKDAKLVRSTSIPRWIWIARIVLSKGVEFLMSIPVLIVFVLLNGATVNFAVLLFPVAVALQAVLLIGLGLIIAPLCVLFSDLDRTTRLLLRVLFYASPVIYGLSDLPAPMDMIGAFNPLAGVFALYRVGFYPEQADLGVILVAVVEALVAFGIGLLVFRRLEPTILKEL